MLFGWLHWPARERIGGTGLVICKPFGYEALCSHRTVRVLAETAAELGIPTLRFDYLGTGDSADLKADANQISAWVADIIAAVNALRQRTGVQSVCLLGLRLGAMLATLAAARCEDVDGLVLGAPVVSGRRYLRELRTTRLASLMAAHDVPPDADLRPDAAMARDGSLEVSGHALSAASLTVLATTDLSTLTALPVSRMLVVDRNDLPAARGWSEELMRLGVGIEYLALPGFVETLMTAPQFAVVPQAIVAAATQWLLGVEQISGRPVPDGIALARRRASAADQPPVLQLPGGSSGQDRTVVERPVSFGVNAQLFGIVTEPCQGEIRRCAVILLNAAADQHIGAGRMYVSLARCWARRGYLVLRMDLAGIGDSGTREGRANDDIFPPGALDDIGTAVQFIQSRYGIHDITLAGLCSGAYHALRAAVAGLPVTRILMVNPQNFFWKEGTALQDLQLAEVVHNPGLYRVRVLSAGAWHRLLTGQVNVWRIVKIYFYRLLLPLESQLRELARFIHIRLPNDLGWELERIGARALRIVFVFSRGDPGIDVLTIQAGSSIKRLGKRCHVHIIDGADHTFTDSGSRAALEKILSTELLVRESSLTSGGT
jgi:pimeloyl-ACP methyl ester carboxylesterase